MTIIVPYNSVGPITFELNEDSVRSTLNAPLSARANTSGELELVFSEQIVRLSPNAGVVEVSVLPEGKPTVSGVEVFTQPDALQVLLHLAETAWETVGFLVFSKLGVAITGLHDGDKSQRAVSAFTRGRWDELVGASKPFRE